jgi:hypothetical protein
MKYYVRRSISLVLSVIFFLISMSVISPERAYVQTNEHWAKSFINIGIDKGYFKEAYGNEDPENEFTRGEFIAALIQALDIKPVAKETDSEWYDPYINAAVEKGVHNYADFTSGDWNSPITRLEIARMSVRATDSSLNNNSSDEIFMYYAVKSGIVGGIWDGTLGLDLPVSTGYAALVLHRILELKNGQVLPIDQTALSYAEVAYSGTNIKAMWGEQFDTVSLPVQLDMEGKTSLDFTVDQILIVDSSQPDSAYFSKYIDFKEYGVQEVKDKEKYIVAVHLNVNAESVPDENMIYVRLGINSIISASSNPKVVRIYYPQDRANEFTHNFFSEEKTSKITDGWIVMAFLKEQIDEYIKFGENNFSIQLSGSNNSIELTTFHKKKSEDAPIQLSKLIKARTTALPFPYYYKDAPAFWTPIKEFVLKDGLVQSYTVEGMHVPSDRNFYQKYDRLLRYSINGTQNHIAFKNVPGLTLEERDEIVDQLFEGKKEAVDRINELLGLNQSAESYTPNIKAISGSRTHYLALSEEGTVYAWGENDSGQLGTGNKEPLFPMVPHPIPDLSDIVAVNAGEYYSLALKRDGSVWIWGEDIIGMSKDDIIKPTQIPELDGSSKIFGENRVINVVSEDGSLWEFGEVYLYYDKLRLKKITDVVSVVESWGKYALKKDGTVWRWHTYADSAFHKKSIEYMETPRPIDNISDVVAIGEGGSDNVLMLKADGTVWEWHPIEDKLTQTSLSDVVALSGRQALKKDGSVWAVVSSQIIQINLPPIKLLGNGIAIGDDGKLYTWKGNPKSSEVLWSPWEYNPMQK